MRVRGWPPLDLIGWIAIVMLPLLAGVFAVSASNDDDGRGAALLEVATLRIALANVGVAAGEARARQDVRVLDDALRRVGTARDAIDPRFTAALDKRRPGTGISEFDRSVVLLSAAARSYATRRSDSGGGSRALIATGRAVDDLLSQIATDIDSAAERRSELAPRALTTGALSAVLVSGALALLWLRVRRERRRSGDLQARLEATRAVSPNLVIEIRADGVIEYASADSRSVLGFENTALLGKPLSAFLIAPALDPEALSPVDALRVEARWRRGDGEEVALRTHFVASLDADGAPDGVVIGVRDAAPVEAIADALQESEDRFRRTVDTAQNGMMIVAPDGRLLLHNESLRRLVGYSADDMATITIGQLVPADDIDRVMSLFAVRMWSDATPAQDDMRLVRRDGETLDVELSVVPFRERGRSIGVLVELRDVTERRVASETIRRLADYDALTGLPNRAHFDRRLTIALMEARDARRGVGVLLVDLDRFKLINDTLGYANGDELLQEVGARLTASLPPRCTVARFGGDEFLVLVPRLDRPEAIAHAAKQVSEALEAPFEQDGQLLRITGSVGGAVFPEHGADADALIKSAGVAMYQAKHQGGNGFRSFDPERVESASARLQLEAELQHALERDEFAIFYQPIVDIERNEIVAAEALLRWKHPQRGLLAASEFIQALEETGQIIAVGEWVLDTACQQMQRWRAGGLPPIRVAVNLSAR
ncbi:MAG: diguanylate cyclase [Chloroflexi bacterium]|nr:diguanylate cyclase [Chloroflexota bacterium]